MADVLDLPSDALVIIPEETAFDVFASVDAKAIEPYLMQIRRKVDEFQPSLRTVTSRKQIASMARKVSESKVYLESIGKKLADDQKEIPKRIDATRRKVKDYLDALRDEVRQPLTDWENAEEARVARHTAAIGAIRALTVGTGLLVDEWRQRLAEAEAVVINDACHEFASDYVAAKVETIAALMVNIAKQEQADADRAELDALRKEKAARDAAEAERAREAAAAEAERQRVEKEAEAKRQSEAAAAAAEKAAAERAELEKTLAAERAKNDALAANLKAQQEAERKAREIAQAAAAEAAAKAKAEADEKAAQAKREADKAHMGKVNRGAVAAFVAGGIDEDVAKAVLKLIITKQIPNVFIQY